MLSGPLLEANSENRFYPKFGKCKDFSDYTIMEELTLQVYIDKTSFFTISKHPEAEVFLTDKKLRTRSIVHKPSHWGPSITIKHGTNYNILVKVEQISNFDPKNPDNCQEYTNGEFENCVDEELQDFWKPIIGCNPPWSSHQYQCNGVWNSSEFNHILYNRTYDTVNSINFMGSYPAKRRCKIPCIETRVNFILSRVTKSNGLYLPSILTLTFDEKVVHKEKVLAYGFSGFLIDMGSSLGLWFGLSVWSIKDFSILLIQSVQKIRQYLR